MFRIHKDLFKGIHNQSSLDFNSIIYFYKLEYSMKDVPIRTHIFKEPIIKEEIFDEYGIIPKVKCYFNELFNF